MKYQIFATEYINQFETEVGDKKLSVELYVRKYFQTNIYVKIMSKNPLDTGLKLNVHKTFRRRPGRLLNVLCTFNLLPVSTGKHRFCKYIEVA